MCHFSDTKRPLLNGRGREGGREGGRERERERGREGGRAGGMAEGGLEREGGMKNRGWGEETLAKREMLRLAVTHLKGSFRIKS